MAKAMIDEDHPLSLGCIERACRQVQRTFLRCADLIIGIGYDTAEVEYEAWIGDRPLLQIDIEPVDIAPCVNRRCLRDVVGWVEFFTRPNIARHGVKLLGLAKGSTQPTGLPCPDAAGKTQL
jgi:hypothetical protein